MERIIMKDLVKDTITGFKGTVVAIAKYMNGCVRCEVQPRGLYEGKPIESQWIDEGQLEIIAREREDGMQEFVSTGGPTKRPANFNNPVK